MPRRSAAQQATADVTARKAALDAEAAQYRQLADSLSEQERAAAIAAAEQANAAANAAVVRWEGREEVESLKKLLDREEVISDAPAAAGELRAALVRLADQAARRRLEALEAKERAGDLSSGEREEFQRLISRLSRREAGGG